MRYLLTFLTMLSAPVLIGQTVSQQITAAFNQLEKDEQFAHATIGFYLVNSKTGQTIFEKNSMVGMAPASTLKVITSASAYVLLGKDFRYTTSFKVSASAGKNMPAANLRIEASGDPVFGSWRWKSTNRETIFNTLADSLKQRGINSMSGNVELAANTWESQATPNGWIWEDVGNYYGAGARAFNYHENSYHLVFKPGNKTGDATQILHTDPEVVGITWINEVNTARPGSGDNAVIYLPENGKVAYVRGTIPAGVQKFSIRGSLPDPLNVFTKELSDRLREKNISAQIPPVSSGEPMLTRSAEKSWQLASFSSPPLDSINYWFMKESINLYGEAFVKTIAMQKGGTGSTATGIEQIKNLWKEKGISPAELKIKDGSGLSPANRITPHALVEVLQFVKKQPWFESFNHSLPVQNNIRMKSGYIGGVRSYAGFISNRAGEQYTFAFIINNFDGSPSLVREKMWKILDLLK